MSQFQFRPRLEVMDERIVPDAGPGALNDPMAPGQAAPANVAPGDMTDAQLRERIGELDVQRVVVVGQINTLIAFATDLNNKAKDANANVLRLRGVWQGQTTKLNGIEAQFGQNSPEYRAQVPVVEAARDAWVKESGRLEALHEAVQLALDQIQSLQNDLTNIVCELELLRAELNGRS